MIDTSYGLLKGKKGIVFGPLNAQSLGWHVARVCHREKAEIAISNVKASLRLGEIEELSKLCNGAPIILCDASSTDQLETAFKEVKDKLGKVDFIVHSIAMSRNIRKQRPYEELNYDWFTKTLDVSALSLHKILSQALKSNSLNDRGSVVALTFIGAQRTFSDYSDMGDAKALLESIARSYGYRLASRGIRVNTVSQSPTKTAAGSGIEGFDALYDLVNKLSPLGNADAEECAHYVVTLLSDLTRKVTMQNLYHDGGFSSIGISEEFLTRLPKQSE